jgi:putative hydrolase of the HAD superfamily
MKHILFDTDGVLVHSEMWSNEYSRRAWLAPHAMKPFFSWVFQDCLIGGSDLREAIAPFLHTWWWEWSVDEYLRAWFDYENKPDTLLIEKIQELRKKWIKCYVATNQEKYRLEYLKKEMHFEGLFEGVFCSAEIWYKKPQEMYYTHVIETLWVDPSEIIYFDDDEKNISQAKSMNIDAHLYTWMGDIFL